MCSHYTALKKQAQLEKYFRTRGSSLPRKSDMWPRYAGPFIRRPPEHDAATKPCLNGRQSSAAGHHCPERRAGKVDGYRKSEDVQREGRNDQQALDFPPGLAAWPALHHPGRGDLRTGLAPGLRRQDKEPCAYPLLPVRRRAAGHRQPVGPLPGHSRPVAGELHHTNYQR